MTPERMHSWIKRKLSLEHLHNAWPATPAATYGTRNTQVTVITPYSTSFVIDVLDKHYRGNFREITTEQADALRSITKEHMSSFEASTKEMMKIVEIITGKPIPKKLQLQIELGH